MAVSSGKHLHHFGSEAGVRLDEARVLLCAARMEPPHAGQRLLGRKLSRLLPPQGLLCPQAKHGHVL
jgi:hypothetical protein